MQKADNKKGSPRGCPFRYVWSVRSIDLLELGIGSHQLLALAVVEGYLVENISAHIAGTDNRAKTEHTVLERIAALPNRTCIAVTHRSAALELAGWQLDIRDKSLVRIKLN